MIFKRLVLIPLFLCLTASVMQAQEIVVRADGAKAVGVAIVADSPSASEAEDMHEEMAWRISFNGVLAARDMMAAPDSVLQGMRNASISDWSLFATQDAEIVIWMRWEPGPAPALRLRVWQQGEMRPALDRSFKAAGNAIHKIYDAAAQMLYRELIGGSGPFGESVYFQKREPKSRRRELSNIKVGFPVEKRITYGQRIVLKPRSNPEGTSLLFIGYANAIPEVWELDVASGRLSRPIPNSSPAYGANYGTNGSLLYSHASGRYSEIVAFRKGKKTVLQSANAMNLSGEYLPDQDNYVFTSDRFGNPHLFVKEGNLVRRLTVDGDYNASPRVSPDGQWVAFARREGGRFSIFVVKMDGTVIRRLTDDQGSDEDPAWSNDGRTIYFSSDRTGSGDLDIWSVDLWTGKLNMITRTSGDERMPEVLRKVK
jgi:TolB protein